MPNRIIDQNQDKFVQERLYIELDYRADPEKEKLRQISDEDDDERGVIIIDIL